MAKFKFKYFEVEQGASAMKIGTDAFLLGALIDFAGKFRALDIGTGTGVLSLIATQKNSALECIAVEIDAAAAEEATKNFANSPFARKPQLLLGDFLSLSQTTLASDSFDLIFSNPPFFEQSLNSPDQQRNLARHDASLPLNQLFENAARLLHPNGDLWVILPHLSSDKQMIKNAEMGLYPKQIITIEGVAGKVIRKIVRYQKVPTVTKHQTVVVRLEDGRYTEDYKNRTADLHFNKLK